MGIIFPILLLVFQLLLIAFCLFLLSMWVSFAFFSKKSPPFVPVSGAIMPEIIKALSVKPGDVVYDLGSGNGKVLFSCQRSEPKAEYVGVEKNRYLVLYCRLRAKLLGVSDSVRFVRRSFHDADLSRATKVFLYLFPQAMSDLYPKLRRELPKGAKVVSCDFKFSEIEPSAVIDLHRDPKFLGRTLYVYDF